MFTRVGYLQSMKKGLQRDSKGVSLFFFVVQLAKYLHARHRKAVMMTFNTNDRLYLQSHHTIRQNAINIITSPAMPRPSQTFSQSGESCGDPQSSDAVP